MKKLIAFTAVCLFAAAGIFAQEETGIDKEGINEVLAYDTPENRSTQVIEVTDTHPELHEHDKDATVKIEYTQIGGSVRIYYTASRNGYKSDEARITVRACLEDFWKSKGLSWSDVSTVSLNGKESNGTVPNPATGGKKKVTTLYMEYYINK